MNGNITQEGIKLDLEWMHRVGLGGIQIFDAALATPQVVDHRLAYMTPEWKQAFKYATSIADGFQMEEAIAGSPGWSETGGPWVPASQGMKKYVWSETVVEGGKPFTGVLAKPPSNTGAFQNIGIRDMLAEPSGARPTPQFYADSYTVAFKAPANDVPLESLHPKITASAGSPDPAILTDGDLVKTTKLPVPKLNESAWIQYEFAEPQTIRSLTIVMTEANPFATMLTGLTNPEKHLEASDDGQNFRLIAKIPDEGAAEHTISFPPVTAKFFRVAFKRLPAPPAPPWLSGIDLASLGIKITGPATDYEVAELVLRPGARVNRFEEKAAFALLPDLYSLSTPSFAQGDVVPKNDVIDLTSKMRADGSLDWTPPEGRWVVLRFGYSLLGITNHPATAEATGLEVDKLNSGYVNNYMENYLKTYADTVGPDFIGKRGIRYVITDSWEAGAQNWTDDMVAQFRKRRGYDPLPWLPVLTGQVVESSEASDQFLWDFRKTIADLIADEHYGQVEASLKAHGIGHYGESHESGRALIADGMEVKKLDDIPMSAMWVQAPGVNTEQFGYNADDRESASVAHIYGQNIAAAESLTAAVAPWAWSPATLKSTADQELLNGINRFVIHESAHQPLVGKAPGLTLGPFGQWFNRNETWAEQAGPWIKYLARNSYLLQQGQFVADVLYFYGEDSNLTALFDKKTPDVPAGYGFDYINADALIHELSVVDGQIVTKSGMKYRLLVLDPYSQHMSLPVLRAIHGLVEQGAIVAGEKPSGTPSLADNHSEFGKLNDELFGNGTGLHTVGKGKVYAGQKADAVLKAMNVPSDFDFSRPENDSHLLFVHRKLADGDIYFVDNRTDHDEKLNAFFRVTGRVPEIWHAETGKSEAAGYEISGSQTTVPLHIEPWGTLFVVFRQPAHSKSHTLPMPTETQVGTVDISWEVAFQAERGAPDSITLDKLISWTASADPGVRYFSGTATYSSTFQADHAWFSSRAKLWLDLGDVKNLAEITLNGKPLGIVWHAPYRVDVSGVLKSGANQITIKVTNSWVNRLIGDQQPNATAKYTFADVKPYKADSPLLPSGLLGPVHVYSVGR